MSAHLTLRQLIHLLEREVELHDRLLRLLREEQALIIEADGDGLDRKVREQEFLVEEIRQLEVDRLALMAELSRRLGVPQDDLSLDRLCGMVEEDQQAALTLVRARLRAVVDDIRKVNDINRHLIENGLQFLQENIQVLFSAGEEEQLFYRPARHERRTAEVRRLVDRKA